MCKRDTRVLVFQREIRGCIIPVFVEKFASLTYHPKFARSEVVHESVGIHPNSHLNTIAVNHLGLRRRLVTSLLKLPQSNLTNPYEPIPL